MRYASRTFTLISVKLDYLASHQGTLRDHGYGLTYHAMCLFTPQLSLGCKFRLLTERRLDLSRPGYLLLRQDGLPVQRRSPI